MFEYLLPIGSVVKLKNIEKPLMVFGILQSNPNISDKTFDYIGVPYPEGHFDIRLHIGFNHGDISDVIFLGFDNEDRKAFMASLEIINQARQKESKGE